MAQDDSYEIIPHQLLADLKAEVSVLKEKLMGPDKVTAELVESMQDLQKSLKSMQEVFNEVLAETKGEEDTSQQEIMKQLHEISDQNQQIALEQFQSAMDAGLGGQVHQAPERQHL